MSIPQPTLPWNTRRIRTAARVAPVVLVIALGGCTGGAGQTAGDAPPSPSPSPSSTLLTPSPEEMEDLDVYCGPGPSDQLTVADEEKSVAGYPDAPEYAGEGPHPAAVFADTPSNNAELPDFKLKDGPSYSKWLPETPEEVELVVCLRPASQGEERLDTCEYTGGGEYPLYEQTYEYTVYSLHTGDEVATGDVPAGSEDCPIAVIGDSPIDEIEEVYTGMHHTTFIDGVEKLVEGGAE
ncbi:hypothetical protein O4J56_27330 [Nocardiopsis sp. RSe5-2]|uniref:Uncharacterized protein n=1 Tax=Nocardiopsis endophytica TaxID=3018445 RepID=A0ABT4UBN2_9ACTN|nr:hypothetical protein [Nocardiopsis endophytica]MDA2814390.1 hypothetical protein [Nocardiopsis endophytica]